MNNKQNPARSDLFSDEWYEEHLENRLNFADNRHSPRLTDDLNVSLPILDIFEALSLLSLSENFYANLNSYSQLLSEAISKVAPYENDESKELLEQLNGLREMFRRIIEEQPFKIDWEDFQNGVKGAIESLEELKNNIGNNEKLKNDRNKAKVFQDGLRQTNSHLIKIKNFFNETRAVLGETSQLLVTGDAGTGKTHLFCDVLEKRISNDRPTILFFGEYFEGRQKFWDRLFSLTKSNVQNKEQFFKLIEEEAKRKNERVLVLIDGINESNPKSMWKKLFGELIKEFQKYDFVGLALSIRSDYIDVCLPDDYHSLIQTEEHPGFSLSEWEAVHKYFRHYNISLDEAPVLRPEFSNPLFLRIFCETFEGADKTKGKERNTHVFEQFVKKEDKKFAEEFDYEKGKNFLWDKIFRDMAEEMVEHKPPKDSLSKQKVRNIISNYLPGKEDALIQAMKRDYLLTEYPSYDENFKVHHYELRFAFQKFSDHFIVRYLLKKHLIPHIEAPEQCFDKSQRLGEIVKDEQSCRLNKNLVTALQVQIPEWLSGKELHNLASHIRSYESIKEGFIESLQWREAETIGKEAEEYIENEILSDTSFKILKSYFNQLLSISMTPGHPQNADGLDELLNRVGMPWRDRTWTIHLHEEYELPGEDDYEFRSSVNRLLEWGQSLPPSEVEDESVILLATTFIWFLTSSNRYLRDRTTKTLIYLLEDKLELLTVLIEKYLQVNDPYVLERLMCVAYGCVMRSDNKEQILRLSEFVYRTFFEENDPPPHILLRDYCRGIVERAISLNLMPEETKKNIHPPFNSEWPGLEILPDSEIEKYRETSDDMDDIEWARVHLHQSVMSSNGISGDFARYVIGTNSSSQFEWLSREVDEERPLSPEEKYESFMQELDDSQKQLLEVLSEAIECCRKLKSPMNSILEMDEPRETDEDEELEGIEDLIKKTKEELASSLDETKRDVFENEIINHLENSSRYEEKKFDIEEVQKWIFSKVLELGWTIELFGKFDRFLTRYRDYGRSANKPERIGKKYQWIAYHECMARLSDNYAFKGKFCNDLDDEYIGPWQIGARDIDPSSLCRKTMRSRFRADPNCWWFQSKYDSWGKKGEFEEWVQPDNHLPSIERIINIENEDWLTLRGNYVWEEEIYSDEDSYRIPHKRLEYYLSSYLIKRENLNIARNWCGEQNFCHRRMPNPPDDLGFFLSEYHWSSAFFDTYQEKKHHSEKTDLYGEAPFEVSSTENSYLWEQGLYDCSLDESVACFVPSRLLSEILGLGRGVEAEYKNQSGEIVVFDPSLVAKGPQALLLNSNYGEKEILESGYTILWILNGQKFIASSTWSEDDDWPGRLQITGFRCLTEEGLTGETSCILKE